MTYNPNVHTPGPGNGLDFSKCQSCGHPKHIGAECIVYVSNDDGTPAHVCGCNEARSRKDDRRKPGGFYLIPPRAMVALARIYHYGAKKYAAHSWRQLKPDPETGADAEERYFDAMMRHLLAFKSGEWLDQESGEPHLAHALWGVVSVFELALDKMEQKGKEQHDSVEAGERR